MLRSLPQNQIIVDTFKADRQEPVPWIKSLTESVSLSTYQSYITQLTSYSTRHSLSSSFSNAITWASDQLNNYGYNTRSERISVGASSSYNLIADLGGHGNGLREIIIVTAHLDSVNNEGGLESNAPGADDNASGSAGLLEMARILSSHTSTHDLRLILFGGEEQGLFGSRRYVADLPVSERSRIRAVINMDMIATLNTTVPRVLLEGAAISSQVMDTLASSASTYTSLEVEKSLNPFASDHVPFIDVQIPAVLTIEGTDSSNTNVHTANDTLDHLNYNLALEIMRMNIAAAVSLLGKEEMTL